MFFFVGSLKSSFSFVLSSDLFINSFISLFSFPSFFLCPFLFPLLVLYVFPSFERVPHRFTKIIIYKGRSESNASYLFLANYNGNRNSNHLLVCKMLLVQSSFLWSDSCSSFLVLTAVLKLMNGSQDCPQYLKSLLMEQMY